MGLRFVEVKFGVNWVVVLFWELAAMSLVEDKVH